MMYVCGGDKCLEKAVTCAWPRTLRDCGLFKTLRVVERRVKTAQAWKQAEARS